MCGCRWSCRCYPGPERRNAARFTETGAGRPGRRTSRARLQSVNTAASALLGVSLGQDAGAAPVSVNRAALRVPEPGIASNMTTGKPAHRCFSSCSDPWLGYQDLGCLHQAGPHPRSSPGPAKTPAAATNTCQPERMPRFDPVTAIR